MKNPGRPSRDCGAPIAPGAALHHAFPAAAIPAAAGNNERGGVRGLMNFLKSLSEWAAHLTVAAVLAVALMCGSVEAEEHDPAETDALVVAEEHGHEDLIAEIEELRQMVHLNQEIIDLHQRTMLNMEKMGSLRTEHLSLHEEELSRHAEALTKNASDLTILVHAMDRQKKDLLLVQEMMGFRGEVLDLMSADIDRLEAEVERLEAEREAERGQ